jgi:hypothetical protein
MLTPTEIRWPSIGVQTSVRTLDRGVAGHYMQRQKFRAQELQKDYRSPLVLPGQLLGSKH